MATVVVAVIELREISVLVPTALLSPAMPLTFGVFKTPEDAKAV
jgi:hypothetical protein